MIRILVTGGSGQLGSELKMLCPFYRQYHFIFPDRKILDLIHPEQMENFIIEHNVDVIINCAAYTNVEKAEDDRESAEAANHTAVAALAKIAIKQNVSLIHISTDYVFDGTKASPYKEDDETNPINTYGKSKCAGENAILAAGSHNTIIIRTSWIFSEHGNNFVKTMLRLGREKVKVGVIVDQVGSPTYAKDLAEVILKIIPEVKTTGPEIYHFSNEGETSWAEFAKEIFLIGGIDCKVDTLTSDQYYTKAKRPLYSGMSKAKIKRDFSLPIRSWREALKECIDRMKLNQ